MFYNRTVKYIEINGEKITDSKTIQLLGEKFKIKTLTHRACMLQDLKEYKTDENYIKYIFDEEIVKQLESWQKFRLEQKKKYLFWDNSDTVFQFEDYDTIVKTQVVNDQEYFKNLFLKVGFKKEDFGTFFRANYALRHFGIQWWLQATDYNYGLIASMGWKDINTLREWYGQYTAQHFEKKIEGIIV